MRFERLKKFAKGHRKWQSKSLNCDIKSDALNHHTNLGYW